MRPDAFVRRDFLKTSAAAAAAFALGASDQRTALSQQPATGQPPVPMSSKPIKKAVKYGMVQVGDSIVEKFKLLKELGFDGVEMDSPTKLDRDEVLQASVEAGLPIHGVVDSIHWHDTLSSADPAVRERGYNGLCQALNDAKHWGASTVLLVPAVVSKEVSYADAYERSQAEVKKALPLAEELNVKICFENVWNNFLLSPLETAQYIDEFDSPYVGAYFDIGNVVRYGWPEQWISVLGPRIVKLDIKEFSRKKMESEGLFKGFEVELLEGDCDWPSVMAALRNIKYEGWATAEIPGGKEERLRAIAGRMDQIFGS